MADEGNIDPAKLQELLELNKKLQEENKKLQEELEKNAQSSVLEEFQAGFRGISASVKSCGAVDWSDPVSLVSTGADCVVDLIETTKPVSRALIMGKYNKPKNDDNNSTPPNVPDDHGIDLVAFAAVSGIVLVILALAYLMNDDCKNKRK